MSFSLSIYRKCWVDAIEGVKRKLEDGETVEADEANDPSNPFSKRGEKKSRKGKSKVVSTYTCFCFFSSLRYPHESYRSWCPSH